MMSIRISRVDDDNDSIAYGNGCRENLEEGHAVITRPTTTIT